VAQKFTPENDFKLLITDGNDKDSLMTVKKNTKFNIYAYQYKK